MVFIDSFELSIIQLGHISPFWFVSKCRAISEFQIYIYIYIKCIYFCNQFKIVIDRYWFFFITDTDYLYVYVPDNRYAEPIFIYCYKVNK